MSIRTKPLTEQELAKRRAENAKREAWRSRSQFVNSEYPKAVDSQIIGILEDKAFESYLYFNAEPEDSGLWSSIIEKLQIKSKGDKINYDLRAQLAKFAPSGDCPEKQIERIGFDESIANGHLDWQFHDPNSEWYRPFWTYSTDTRDCRENTNDSPSNDFFVKQGRAEDFGGIEDETIKEQITELMKEIF